MILEKLHVNIPERVVSYYLQVISV